VLNSRASNVPFLFCRRNFPHVNINPIASSVNATQTHNIPSWCNSDCGEFIHILRLNNDNYCLSETRLKLLHALSRQLCRRRVLCIVKAIVDGALFILNSKVPCSSEQPQKAQKTSKIYAARDRPKPQMTTYTRHKWICLYMSLSFSITVFLKVNVILTLICEQVLNNFSTIYMTHFNR
jgi:hypothetical protein